MKMAISAQGTELDSMIDPRFGRAKYFILFDLETNTHKSVENIQNLNATQGAGIQSASLIAKEEVEAVITGHCGPKAFVVLNKAKIKVFIKDGITVKEAISLFKKNKIVEIKEANVEGHW
ncbi:MAG: NifB/NifX family molybdenum-iron cluster-binding protein [Oligoflexia bacterium]|nr:NifB/NifX family molybdenum-iron cluster-binding protein [Oligoflexia bacterium]MBF0367546.1 NifB/NifX family molybdenum-iron cluster-binding protein [Oligoflexia bacterium]